jgi:hypothetical protein
MVQYDTPSGWLGFSIGFMISGFYQVLMDETPVAWDFPISFGLFTLIVGIGLFIIAYWKLKNRGGVFIIHES